MIRSKFFPILAVLFILGGANLARAGISGSQGLLQPFTTDGCSDFPDGTDDEPTLWQHCCVEHDLRYWAGGTFAERLDADLELARCVADTGNPLIAKAMLAGVRVGGSPFFPTPFRWGYGWDSLRGYRALDAEELQQVKALTPSDLSTIPITSQH